MDKIRKEIDRFLKGCGMHYDSIEPYSTVWKGELGQKGLDYTIKYMKSLLKM